MTKKENPAFKKEPVVKKELSVKKEKEPEFVIQRAAPQEEEYDIFAAAKRIKEKRKLKAQGALANSVSGCKAVYARCSPLFVQLLGCDLSQERRLRSLLLLLRLVAASDAGMVATPKLKLLSKPQQQLMSSRFFYLYHNVNKCFS